MNLIETEKLGVLNPTSTEKFISDLDCTLYPITIVKFLLNKKRILNYFKKAGSEDFEIRGFNYLKDYSECSSCNERKEQNMLCRQHTSIYRVLEGGKVAFDEDTNVYFYKNEIFRMVGNRLVIVYCPHPKLMLHGVTDDKVRKINPITIEDSEINHLPNFESVTRFESTNLMKQQLKCWFNDEFSIITLPDSENKSNWCLISNR